MKSSQALAVEAALQGVDADLSPIQVRALKNLMLDFLQPGACSPDPIVAVMASISDQARASGITDEELDAELESYNVERRN